MSIVIENQTNENHTHKKGSADLVKKLQQAFPSRLHSCKMWLKPKFGSETFHVNSILFHLAGKLKKWLARLYAPTIGTSQTVFFSDVNDIQHAAGTIRQTSPPNSLQETNKIPTETLEKVK